ncbi:MAG: hypothetical protein NTV49_14355, partial [Kiritimatiellaeota bacterium]|nr:hypothetical protein [Kiritimatiellota bacterium]
GAGNQAAARDAERLAAHGIECFRVKFPWGMDANEYAQKMQPPGKALQTVLNAAEWCGGKADVRPMAPPVAAEASRTRAPAPSSESLAAESAADDKEQPKPEPAAQPKPATPACPAKLAERSGEAVALDRVGEYHVLRLGQREYRIGGLEKNNSLEVLKVSLRLMVWPQQLPVENDSPRPTTDNPPQTTDGLFHLDSFDMAQDAQRRRFIERAAEETGLEKDLIKRDLGRLLLALEAAQTDRISSVLNPDPHTLHPKLSSAEREEALAFLKSPDLVEQIGAAFDACGLAGEDANRLAAYLACTSRHLDKPLAVIIQSTSAAGKSALMEAVLAMFPEEARVKYSAMTGQSLYYLGETDLQHKILAIVEEEGAEKASYALKLLQSDGELTIASTGKDPKTGRLETQEYHVAGPVMIFLTTTAVDIAEELQNRCLTLTVDESREQTARIHTLQRQARTLDGWRRRKQKARLLKLLCNAQRLLLPVDIVNPWAAELTFTANHTRTRRDHEKYLTLIDAIALLHQHQRPREVDPEAADLPSAPAAKEGENEFIRVTVADIALANRLAPELLGRALDELPPQTRRVYEAVKAIIREKCDDGAVGQRFAFFSRREVRQRLGWSATQIRFHLERLRELEYIAAHYGRPGSAFQYELLTDCREPRETTHIGLLDVEKLLVPAQPPPGGAARVTAKPLGAAARLRQPTCRENQPPVGGCRDATRQVQCVAEPCLTVNLSACCEHESGAPATAPA